MIIKPPQGHDTVFLAGSIEMGTAIDWQTEIGEILSNLIVLNPRRNDWDSSWEQSIDNEQFYKQVSWELDGLEKADFIIFNFVPGTQSPITLLELGLFAREKTDQIVVCCPEGFWRKGNVDIVCEKLGIQQVNTYKDLKLACARINKIINDL